MRVSNIIRVCASISCRPKSSKITAKNGAYPPTQNGHTRSLFEWSLSRHEALQQDARAVINRNVTCRAWVTGYYIVEYEQNGNDRAKYGEQLLSNLSKRLGEKSFSHTNLKSYRKFYLLYPELNSTIAGFVTDRFTCNMQIIKSLQLSAKSQSVIDQLVLKKAGSWYMPHGFMICGWIRHAECLTCRFLRTFHETSLHCG
jgi:hypothetical protein